MSDIEIGELYLVKDWFWLLFPTKEMAAMATVSPLPMTPTISWATPLASAMARGSGRAEWAYQAAKWFGEQYNCNVCVVEENTYVVLLEQDEAYFKVLDSNGNIGWIVCHNFSKFFELVKAKQ